MNKTVRRILDAVSENRVNEEIRSLASGLLSPRSRSPEKAPIASEVKAAAHRAGRRMAEKLAIATMRAEVFAWNLIFWGNAPGLFYPHGRCDSPDCGKPFSHNSDGELDHWIERSLGGEHTRENGWRLCTDCHHAKGAAQPSREMWNLRRKRYCKMAEIVFMPRRVK